MALDAAVPETAWAERHFGGSGLGDERLRRRLVMMAGAMAARPSESLPKQFEQWTDLTGAYRLLNNPRVDPDAMQRTHRDLTLRSCAGRDVVLCVQDTTELDYSGRRGVKGLGRVGAGGRGILQHATLAVCPRDGLLGVLHCRWHCRAERIEGETKYGRLKRWRESLLWPESVAALPAAPEGTRFVTVTDRGGDAFATLEACIAAGHGFVIRAGRRRNVDDGEQDLWEAVRGQKVLGTRELEVVERSATFLNKGRKGRSATVEVRSGRLTLKPPRQRTSPMSPRTVTTVYVRELDPPEGEEPIEWLLLTSETVKGMEDAERVIGWYRKRWVIEEWHRAQKEGCGVERAQFDDVLDLTRLASLTGVLAVRLLQVRDLARKEGEDAARADVLLHERMPRVWIEVVARLAKATDASSMTAQTFVRTIARRGGWLARKHDGPPGWKTIWKGWYDIAMLVEGVLLARSIGGSV